MERLFLSNLPKKLPLFPLIFLTTFLAYSKSVSIKVVQHSSIFNTLSGTTSAIEEAAIDTLFNKGFIASNSPAEVLTTNSEDEKIWSLGYTDALNGGFEYYLQLSLYYNTTITNPRAIKLSALNKLSYRIVKVKTGLTLKEDAIDIQADSPKDSEEQVKGYIKTLLESFLPILK